MFRLIIIAIVVFWALKLRKYFGLQAARGPYAVLGVSPNASPDAIHAAYLALIQQYHPDRLAHVAPELRDLAQRRTQEINAAYAALKRG